MQDKLKKSDHIKGIFAGNSYASLRTKLVPSYTSLWEQEFFYSIDSISHRALTVLLFVAE
jgi:hypothetical protein